MAHVLSPTNEAPGLPGRARRFEPVGGWVPINPNVRSLLPGERPGKRLHRTSWNAPTVRDRSRDARSAASRVARRAGLPAAALPAAVAARPTQPEAAERRADGSGSHDAGRV